MILLALMLFISGCSGFSPRPYQTDYHTGRDGIVLEFLPNSPPEEVIEGSILPVYLSLSNEGAFTLNESAHGVISFSFTETFLELMPNTAPESWDIVPAEGAFFGKSMMYPQGEQRFHLLPSLFAVNLPGQISNPPVIVSASLCYPYKTILSDEICIDTTPMTGDVRRKVCELEDKSYPQGQGGPVAITSVDFEMQQYGLHMRPVLFIEVQNVGGGRVLAPADPSVACQDQGSMSRQWNHVIVKASLSGEELTCVNDGLMDLNNGIIRCYMQSGGFGAHLNYYANLEITLDYVYRSSISKEFEIYRIDAPELMPVDDGCEYWEAKVSADDGDCVSRCEACSSGQLACGVVFPEVEASTWECVPLDMAADGGILKTPTIQPFFYDNSNCIDDPGFCAPGSVCCARPACFNIDSCNDYGLSKDSCNANICEISTDCYWDDDIISISGGSCEKCDPFNEDGCNIYPDEDTCDTNPCHYENGCKWDSSFFGKCRNVAGSCEDYEKINDCIFDVDRIRGDCMWTGLDECVDCPEPVTNSPSDCEGDQTACLQKSATCYWEDEQCKVRPIDNCALYNHKKSCREDPCGLATSSNMGCSWNNDFCTDPNLSVI